MEAARYIQPDVSEARITRLWSQISGRLEQKRPRRLVWLGRGAFGLTATAALWFAFDATRLPSATGVALEPTSFETRTDSSNVALSDGSAVELAPQSHLDLVESKQESVKLSLAYGRVTCDVAKNTARAFSVLAGDVVVKVVGTKFSVSRNAGRVEVEVQRGVVEVKTPRRGEPLRLSAGQSYREEPAEAKPPVSEPERTEPERPEPKPASSVSGARELFDEANDVRRGGDISRAAELYETLLRRYPTDGRAGLAAFELGRLRMDSLNDLPGAASALERAVTMTPGGFREDAIARLVRVYDSLGRSADCLRAKERYLKGYPNGVHRDAIAERCGGS
jgi:transmembrane sensor